VTFQVQRRPLLGLAETMRERLGLLLVLVTAFLPALAADLPRTAQPEEAGLSSERLDRIRRVFQRHIDQGDISGAVTLVARHNRVAHFEALGLMDIAAQKPMQKDALFRLASMTKPITSAAVLMLYEEGRFQLDFPVSRFIPEFKNARVAVRLENGEILTEPAQREITIRHLLTHTSGLPTRGNGLSQELFRELEGERPDITLADWTRRLARLPLNFHPGTAWEYGPATDVLGYLVEVVSGMSFDEFLHRRIFGPLRMNDTYFNVPAQKLSRVAVLYTPVTGKGLQIFNPPGRSWTKARFFSGAGGLASTAGDYYRFCQMLLNGGQLDGIRLLSRKTVELMASNAIGNLPYRASQPGHRFGYGVRVQVDVGESGLIGSPGTYGWDGAFNTHFWIDPKEQLIGILMLQLEPYDYLRMRHEFQVLATAAIAD
jgi:CubicO group peptidase (beta-lactamase class C family)